MSLEKCLTKLIVRGYSDQVSVDDLWQIFATYGEIASIIVDVYGATVTFKDSCSFPGQADFEMELTFGNKKMSVMKLGEVAAGYGDNSGHVQQQYDYYQDYQYQPAYYPHYPPPLSPQYDAAILDVGHCQTNMTVPPPQFVPVMSQFSVPPPPIVKNQQSAFTFDTPAGDNDTNSQTTSGCYICSGSDDSLQPLTPISPSYQPAQVPAPVLIPPTQYLTPPPTFYLPNSPASSTLLSLSGTSLLSTDSSSTLVMPIGSAPQPSVNPRDKNLTNTYNEQKLKYFKSPYKKFSKFNGVPTPAKFPLSSVSASNVFPGGVCETEDKSSWYKAGDRWGHRHSVRSISQSEIDEQRNQVKTNMSTDSLDESALCGFNNLNLG